MCKHAFAGPYTQQISFGPILKFCFETIIREKLSKIMDFANLLSWQFGDLVVTWTKNHQIIPI